MNIRNTFTIDGEADTLFHPGEKKWPFYGLLIYTMMFYSQFAGRYPFLAPLRLEFFLGITLIIYAFAQIFSGKVRFKENLMNFAALLFISIAFITIPFAYVKISALNAFYDLLKFFAIYLMIITTINNEKKLKVFVYVYEAMIVLIFFEPFIQSLQGKGFIWNNGMWRLRGVTNYFGHPNQLGGMTAANLPFLFYLFKYQHSKFWKIIYLILIIASLRVIMLTQSRTAFVGVMAFAFFVWIFSKKKVISIVAISIVLLITWYFAPPETRDRFLTLGMADRVVSGRADHDEAGSMYSRWVLIQRGFEAFKENPIIGLGLNCYMSFNGHRYGYFFPPHNTYIQALSEMGIVGTFAFLLVLFMTLSNLIKSKKRLNYLFDKYAFLETMISVVMVYLLVRMVVSMFGQELYDNYWWIGAGLSVVIFRIVNQKVDQSDLIEINSIEEKKLPIKTNLNSVSPPYENFIS